MTTLTEDEQFQALNILDFLSDLFTATDKEVFTRAEVLIVLDAVKSDRDFFDPLVVIAQQIATQEVDHQ